MRRALLAALLSASCGAGAQGSEKAPPRELIYGAELMTRAEREDYRQALERAKSGEEADRIRDRHRDRIQRRARARGESLDDAGLVEKPRK